MPSPSASRAALPRPTRLRPWSAAALALTLAVLFLPATTLAAPAAPSYLRSDAPDVFSVILRWDDNSNREDGFRIAQLDEGEDINNPAHWDNAAVVGPNVTSVRISGLQPRKTYWFKARSYNSNGYSDYSNIVQVTTASELPAAPSGLLPDPPDAFSVILRWFDNSPGPGHPFGEDGFNISRLDEGEDPNNPAHWDRIATTGPNDRSVRAQNLQPDSRYWFRVRAFNQYGNSDYSNVVEIRTAHAVPATPEFLRADSPDVFSVIVRWDDWSPSPGYPLDEDGFNISALQEGEDFNNPAHWDRVGQVGPNQTSHRVTGLLADTTYWLRVRAYNAHGFSEYSNVIQIHTKPAVPAAPSNLRSDEPDAYSVILRWDDNAPGSGYPIAEDGFNVSQLDEGEDPNNPAHWDKVAETAADGTSVRVHGLLADRIYKFRVRAKNVYGFSDYSNVITLVTGYEVPGAPENARAEAVGATSVTVRWDDMSPSLFYPLDEDGFNLSRLDEGEDPNNFAHWDLVAQVGRDVTSQPVAGLQPGHTYWFRVRAFNEHGFSDFSNVVEVHTVSTDPAHGPALYTTDFQSMPTGELLAAPGDPAQGEWFASLVSGDAIAQIVADPSNPTEKVLSVLAPSTNPAGLQTIARKDLEPTSVNRASRVSLSCRVRARTSDLDGLNPYSGSVELRGGPHPGYQVAGLEFASGNGTPKGQAGVNVRLAGFDVATSNNTTIPLSVGQGLGWDQWIDVRLDVSPITGQYLELEIDGVVESLAGVPLPRSCDGGTCLVGGQLEEILVSTVPHVWNPTGQSSDDTFEIDDLQVVVEQSQDPTGVEDSDGSRRVPTSVFLVSPNPARDPRQVVLGFALPRRSEVAIELFDLRGRRVAHVTQGYDAGTHQVPMSLVTRRELPNGVYFLRLQFDGQTISRKLTVVR